ncbi:hypothetical protein KP509_1Z062900 [Ceratopteris richardii]|nr:hypothetical protein KP509_1Z062900 [Ceratopteris richardii]
MDSPSREWKRERAAGIALHKQVVAHTEIQSCCRASLVWLYKPVRIARTQITYPISFVLTDLPSSYLNHTFHTTLDLDARQKMVGNNGYVAAQPDHQLNTSHRPIPHRGQVKTAIASNLAPSIFNAFPSFGAHTNKPTPTTITSPTVAHVNATAGDQSSRVAHHHT